jgi:hypothetical protein
MGRQECWLPLWCVLPCLPESYSTCMCVHSHTTFALSLCAKCCLHLLLLRLLEAYDRLLPVGPTVGTPAVVITNCLLQHFMLSVSLPRQAFTLTAGVPVARVASVFCASVLSSVRLTRWVVCRGALRSVCPSYAGAGARMDATWVGVVIKEPEQTYRECHLYLGGWPLPGLAAAFVCDRL